MMKAWVNGVPCIAPASEVEPTEPILVPVPAGALSLTGANILAMRFEAGPQSQKAGLMGRVFVVGKSSSTPQS